MEYFEPIWMIAALAMWPTLTADPARANGGTPPMRPSMILAQIPLPDDEVLWNTVRDKGYLELYEYFIAKFPANRRAEEARLAIAILKGEITPNAPVEEPEPEQLDEGDDLNLDPLNLPAQS